MNFPGDMDARCRIELFGGLRVRQGSGAAARLITRFQTRKTGALLAYLSLANAADPERPPQSRETVVGAVWPDDDLDVGRHKLSVALSSLRRQLEPPGLPPGAVLLADRFTVGLNPLTIATDVAEFEAALSAAEVADGSERAELLGRALALYHGELLPGYYEEWVTAEQRRLGERYLEALRQRAADLEAAGDAAGALECAQRVVAADPLREESRRELMRLYAAAGQPEAALRQYQELEETLKGELGVAPAAATRVLAEKTRLQAAGGAGSPARGAPARRLAPTPSGAAGPAAGGARTVTFLVTDIEGSAAPGEHAGEAFDEALPSRHAALREQIRRHGGQELLEARNSLLSAFRSAADALRCAVSAQQALATVRMGLHTGDVEPGAGEDDCPAGRRAARIMLAGHGGQILCSEATAALVRRDLDPGVRLIDLGVFQLPEGTSSERILQVQFPSAARHEFPPLRAEGGYTGSLPLRLSRFIGREPELEELVRLLRPAPLLPCTPAPLPPSSAAHRRLVTSRGRAARARRGSRWRWPAGSWGRSRVPSGSCRCRR